VLPITFTLFIQYLHTFEVDVYVLIEELMLGK